MKERLNNIIENEIEGWINPEEAKSYGLIDAISTKIELMLSSNYIPKEEHEKLKQEYDWMNNDSLPASSFVKLESDFQKLKEENTLLEKTLQISQHEFSELAIVNLKIKEENERLKLFLDKTHCDCAPDLKSGNTTVRCCNQCGLPEEEFWRKPSIDLNKE